MSSTGSLDLNNIQGDILLSGLPKKAEILLFFEIADAQAFCSKLKQVADEIAHTVGAQTTRERIANNRNGGVVPTAAANIAFSFQGLQKVSQA